MISCTFWRSKLFLWISPKLSCGFNWLIVCRIKIVDTCLVLLLLASLSGGFSSLEVKATGNWRCGALSSGPVCRRSALGQHQMIPSPAWRSNLTSAPASSWPRTSRGRWVVERNGWERGRGTEREKNKRRNRVGGRRSPWEQCPLTHRPCLKVKLDLSASFLMATEEGERRDRRKGKGLVGI